VAILTKVLVVPELHAEARRMNPMLAALANTIAVFGALFLEAYVVLVLVLIVGFGFTVNLCALGGIGCCTVLLAWWGYCQASGLHPDSG
jgi:hypothetical protein